MTTKISAGALRAALNQAAAVQASERHTVIPVLRCLKLQGRRMIANTLKMRFSMAVPCLSSGRKPIVAEFGRLAGLLTGLRDDDPVTIAADGDDVMVRFNGGAYHVPSLPATDFPEFSTVRDNVMSLATDNMNIRAALAATRFAVSTEETRYYLNGVCLSQDKNKNPVAVATDGHRMAIKPLSASVGNHNVIIPTAAVDTIIRQKAEPKTCTFDTDHARARFDWAGASLDTQLVDGKYPEWTRVVPDAPEPYIIFDRRELAAAVRRARAWLAACYGRSERIRAVEIRIARNAAELHFGPVNERGHERVSCVVLQGGSFRFGLNIHYLAGVLNAFKMSDQVTFSVTPGDSIANEPWVVTGDGTDLRVVQMPMRV